MITSTSDVVEKMPYPDISVRPSSNMIFSSAGISEIAGLTDPKRLAVLETVITLRAVQFENAS